MKADNLQKQVLSLLSFFLSLTIIQIDAYSSQLAAKSSENSQNSFELDELRKRSDREIASLRSRVTHCDEEVATLRTKLREEIETNRDLVKTKNLSIDSELRSAKEYTHF